MDVVGHGDTPDPWLTSKYLIRSLHRLLVQSVGKSICLGKLCTRESVSSLLAKCPHFLVNGVRRTAIGQRRKRPRVHVQDII